jgi:hypothetical protein
MDAPDNRPALSLALGLVGLLACQLTAPVAAYLGYAAIRDARERGEDADPMAIIGLTLGLVGTVLLLFLGAMLLAYFVFVVGAFVLYFGMVLLILVGAALSA